MYLYILHYALCTVHNGFCTEHFAVQLQCWAFANNMCITGVKNASRRFEPAGLQVGVGVVMEVCKPALPCSMVVQWPATYLQAHPVG